MLPDRTTQNPTLGAKKVKPKAKREIHHGSVGLV
jgi:hypothetical protein